METMYKKFLKKLSRGSKRGDVCNEKFSTLKTDEKRVKFMLRHLQKYRIRPNMKIERKNASMSVKFQRQAKELYNKSPEPEMNFQFDSIIELYTKSVAYAPLRSDELTLAYTNRSAVLFYAGFYKACLHDIIRAFMFINSRDDVREVLLRRSADCLTAMNVITPLASRESLINEACCDLETKNMNVPERIRSNPILNDFKWLASAERPRLILDSDDSEEMDRSQRDFLPQCREGPSIIELKYSEELGRHMVAAGNIRPGEIFIIKQDANPSLNIDSRYVHCWSCLKQTWSGIPCDYCVEVIYCSEACKYTAWKDHHDIECTVIGPLLALEITDLEISALRLTVRAVKQAGSFHALKKELKAIDSFTTDLKTQDENKYASVYTLKRNNGEEMKIDQLFRLTFESTILLYILVVRSNMFGEDFDADLTALNQYKWVTFVGGLILRNKQIIKTNCRQVSEGDDKMINKQTTRTTIKTSISVFNDNSDFTTNWPEGRTFSNNNFINEGEPIFDCNGPWYIRILKEPMQNPFEGCHRFICDCIAYRANSPKFPGLPSFLVQNLPERPMTKLTIHKKDILKELLMYCGNIDDSLKTEFTQNIELQQIFRRYS